MEKSSQQRYSAKEQLKILEEREHRNMPINEVFRQRGIPIFTGKNQA